MLPFVSRDSIISGSIEKDQQISSVITRGEQKTVYFSVGLIPDIPDEKIPKEALRKAIHMWEADNPHLTFVQSNNANIEIRWNKQASTDHTGLATCKSILLGTLSQCILDISVGDEDCNGNYIQNDESMVINILMHEIGHALGLGHTTEEGHLMYSDENPQTPYDEKGYIIPDRQEDLYVGQSVLLFRETQLRDELESVEEKIVGLRAEHKKTYGEYRQYEGQEVSPEEYEIAQELFHKVNAEVDEINRMVEKQNELVERINDIVKQLGCNPNFDVEV